MSWGTRRRNFILWVIFIIVFVPTAFVIFNLIYEPPNCFDGKLNGDETGVDCGGSCALVCEQSTRDVVILWKRYFPISDGVYNVVAMVENPNVDAGLELVDYEFQLYDRQNILLTERKGQVRVPPKATFPVVETALETGELEPRRVAFEFTSDFNWLREVPKDPVLVIRDQKLLNENTEPRINALISNTSIATIRNIDVIAIVYDNQGNAIGSSSTFVEKVEKNELVNLVFTWPEPFDKNVSRIEIIPLYETAR